MTSSPDPKKFQTVQWWIDILSEYPKHLPVRIITGVCEENIYLMLSAYEHSGLLYIDVGDK